MDAQTRRQLQVLPQVDEALRALDAGFARAWPRAALVQAIREEIEALRRRILDGKDPGGGVREDALAARLKALLRPSLRPVLNATGVVVHTNLGRAPLGAEILARIEEVARGYSTLEYDLQARGRGSRHTHAATLLRALTGAEDAIVVNNNAAAVLLCLSALAQGREVVVSRGELIEIGGSFRLPEVMTASGARLCEVGTTNRTHLRDYEAAVGEGTALLLKAHRSNFAVVGFTREVEPSELAALGRKTGVPTMYDLGSGSLVPLSDMGLPEEETVQAAVAQGFDLVTFSGDKLLGGPQAGLIVGRRELVARLRSHPLMRPLRPDKMTLAGLIATLECYRDGTARTHLPVLRLLARDEAQLRREAASLRRRLRRGLPATVEVGLKRTTSRVGGGSSPLAAPASMAVTLAHPRLGPDALEALLRGADPPVVARIEDGRLLLDLRTLPPEVHPLLASALTQVLAQIDA